MYEVSTQYKELVKCFSVTQKTLFPNSLSFSLATFSEKKRERVLEGELKKHCGCGCERERERERVREREFTFLESFLFLFSVIFPVVEVSQKKFHAKNFCLVLFYVLRNFISCSIT